VGELMKRHILMISIMSAILMIVPQFLITYQGENRENTDASDVLSIISSLVDATSLSVESDPDNANGTIFITEEDFVTSIVPSIEIQYNNDNQSYSNLPSNSVCAEPIMDALNESSTSLSIDPELSVDLKIESMNSVVTSITSGQPYKVTITICNHDYLTTVRNVPWSFSMVDNLGNKLFYAGGCFDLGPCWLYRCLDIIFDPDDLLVLSDFTKSWSFIAEINSDRSIPEYNYDDDMKTVQVSVMPSEWTILLYMGESDWMVEEASKLIYQQLRDSGSTKDVSCGVTGHIAG